MKTNKEKYPNTDEALAAWKNHREECKCDCKFESWLKQPCDEEIKKYVKDMPKGVGVAIAGLFAGLVVGNVLADLAEAAKERGPKGEPDDAKADDKRDGLKCPLCGGEHGEIGGFFHPLFMCPDCHAAISKQGDNSEKSLRALISGAFK